MEIYVDYASSTPLDKRVKKAMDSINDYANPNSLHNPGRTAKETLESARRTAAKILKCEPSEIIFTSGGTESTNTAIKGVARFFKKGHIITTSIEHKSVLESCKELEKEGFEVTYIDVSKDGIVDAENIKKTIKKNTILVSVSYVNNEIGTIQPVKKISEICRLKKIAFHCDVHQAPCYLETTVEKIGADLISISGNRIYGPKSSGILYVNKKINIVPLIVGENQESGIRSGSEDIRNITGIVKALEISHEERDVLSKKNNVLRNELLEKILERIPSSFVNGSTKKRISNNLNVSIPGLEGESLMLYLNEHKIYASTGSACASQSLSPSHVILGLGHSPEIAHSSLRITLGRSTTKKQVEKIASVLPRIAGKLRKMSTTWEGD